MWPTMANGQQEYDEEEWRLKKTEVRNLVK
jgi:hypothetical protein